MNEASSKRALGLDISMIALYINSMKQLMIRLDKEMHKDLRRLCLEKDVSVQQFLQGFIEREIEKFNKKRAKLK